LRLGVLLYQAHLYKEALEALKLLLEAEDEMALKTAGAAAFCLRDWKKCVSYLERLDADKDADVLLMLVQSYLAIPDTGKAEVAIKKLEKLSPDDYRVFAAYGCLYLLKSRFNESVASFKKAIEKGDNSASTRLNLASALERLEKYPEAINYCEEALKLAPGDYATLLLLASLYTKVSRYDEAEKILEEFLRLYPNSAGAPKAREALKALKERKK
ncbi:MAG: tetratricopeptide repeat protein, partial [Planctomycetota bacterium]|nr:tetratricopeptide repeat protein [Planctomycetota bacterium]